MNLLDILDSFFKDKKQTEIYGVLFLPILLFGFISIYMIIPPLQKEHNQITNKNQQLYTTIRGLKSRKTTLEMEIKQYPTQIKKLKKELKSKAKEREILRFLLKELQIFRFNMNIWINLINEIPNIAKKYHIKILSISNQKIQDDENKNSIISKKLIINIKGNGDYINILKFIKYAESKKELITVQKAIIKDNYFDITFSIFGANL